MEYIWALILATTRHIVHEDKSIKAGDLQWQSTCSRLLGKQTVQVKPINVDLSLKPFNGMKVIGHHYMVLTEGTQDIDCN